MCYPTNSMCRSGVLPFSLCLSDQSINSSQFVLNTSQISLFSVFFHYFFIVTLILILIIDTICSQASEDAKKLVEEERAYARAEIENARAAVQRVEEALHEYEQMSGASGKQVFLAFWLSDFGLMWWNSYSFAFHFL